MLHICEKIKNYIEESGFIYEYIKIKNNGQHFFAIIVSKNFEDKSLLERHKIIYNLLGSNIFKEIHAFSMTTLTPKEWKLI